MNSAEFLDAYPSLRETLLNSKFLDIIPGGFSIATDVSCETIVHNPITAKFLRIEPWERLSYSSPELSVKVYKNGKQLTAKDLPTQRAAWYGEEVAGCEIEFVWEDGISRIGRFSSSPLRDESGKICGAITTMEDITDLVHIARELDRHKMHLEDLVEERTEAWRREYEKREKAEKEAWQSEIEKKLMEHNLKLAEERFTKAFYLSPQQKSIIRLSDWRYIDVNKSFARARNQSREEIIGRTPFELGVPHEEVETVFRLLEEQGSIDNFEVVIPKHNGTFGIALLSADQIDRIAASHNASIDVDSGSQGTTFFVRFNPFPARDLENV